MVLNNVIYKKIMFLVNVTLIWHNVIISDWVFQQWRGSFWLGYNSLPTERNHHQPAQAVPSTLRTHRGVQQQIQVSIFWPIGRSTKHWDFCFFTVGRKPIRGLKCYSCHRKIYQFVYLMFLLLMIKLQKIMIYYRPYDQLCLVLENSMQIVETLPHRNSLGE